MTLPKLHILCNEAATGRSDRGKDVVKLRTYGSHRNVRLELDDVSRGLNCNIPPQLVDLIEIATLVYVADQIKHRGAFDVESMGAYWRRRLHFDIPVRQLSLWKSPEVSDALIDLLSFLSEDEYEFRFRKYEHPPTLDSYLNFGAGMGAAGKPESVILFSGGLDSLGGVVERVIQRSEHAILVTHESTTKLRTRHRTLRSMIDSATTGPPPQHITIRIQKKDQREREYTQRARSFLYAALATTTAQMADLDAVSFYENGVVSLNLPLSPQVVGSRATRTTHPLVLRRMHRLFSAVTGAEFGVENGFLWKTKAEVVRGLVEAGQGSMIPWSTSCTHTWNMSNAMPHCGECSQCIDRRFAVLAGGAEPFENAETYKRDLLLDDRPEGESRIMLASYVELAQQVTNMSEADFFGRFGEASRILRHVGLPVDEAAREVFKLYQRHAGQVMSVVDSALSKHSARIRARNLPASCLLRLIHDPGISDGSILLAAHRNVESTASHQYQLEKRGQGWLLRFEGVETYLEAQIGLLYLRALINVADKAFTDAQLLLLAYPEARTLTNGRGEAAFDHIAANAYYMRLCELDAGIEQAVRERDVTLAATYRAEKADILDQFKKSHFLGRAKTESRDRKRLRDRVRNAINRSLDTMAKYNKPAAEHFYDSINRGEAITYAPRIPLEWVI